MSLLDYYMTIGNAYQYLKAKGVEIEIYPDGSGFCVYAGEQRIRFGNKLRVSLSSIYLWGR